MSKKKKRQQQNLFYWEPHYMGPTYQSPRYQVGDVVKMPCIEFLITKVDKPNDNEVFYTFAMMPGFSEEDDMILVRRCR